ncbi:hypothetical protein [Polyangium aurulentum]|uniref:hypothetical protein n=1 Tax=Polyangium aurulentum TaxID=2567896 RepID=UPI0010ADF459|nr:hypothetical protein [Polyangium aurulentum]UQA60210.1 hypothetical protein E8A73_006940 [Polyangium aurulentum]
MTRRRRTILAVAVTAAALVTVGLGAYGGDDPEENPCETDLARVFELAALESERLPEEYREAATAGGIMSYCPEQVSCTELDPIWCAPCEDMHGALFWRNLDVASTRCNAKLGWDYSKVDKVAYEACFVEKTEQQCPALEGTDWHDRLEAVTPKQPIRVPYERLYP